MSMLINAVCLAVAVSLFSHGLTPRYPLRIRIAIMAALPLVATGIFSTAVFLIPYPAHSKAPQPSDAADILKPAARYAPLIIMFSAVLIVCVAVVHRLYRMSIQTAMFCATAGYTVQNLASGTTELAASIMRANGIDPTLPIPYLANTVICVTLIYSGCHLLLVRRINHDGLASMANRQMTLMLPVTCLIIIGYDVVLKSLEGIGLGLNYILILRLLHGFACVATLWTEYKLLYETSIEQERVIAEHLLHERERQYQISRETIEAINIKCHDLRHQIRILADQSGTPDRAAILDITQTLSIYDSSVLTGNDALDTILTEKQLLCTNQGITLTCTADGKALNFMAPADLYALFGNALDNAIEASNTLAQGKHQSITVAVRHFMGCVSVHVENYYGGDLHIDHDGLPITSKITNSGIPDTTNHGFGTRSMMAIVKRYGGTFSITAQDGTYCIDIMFPIG